jgi:hypothetical protein
MAIKEETGETKKIKWSKEINKMKIMKNKMMIAKIILFVNGF